MALSVDELFKKFKKTKVKDIIWMIRQGKISADRFSLIVQKIDAIFVENV